MADKVILVAQGMRLHELAAKYSTPKRLGILRGSAPTGRCAKGDHNDCKGFGKSMHGVRSGCTCRCHKSKA